jgi:DNA replication protein DnaC
MEARDERRLRTLQKQLATVKLLTIDELGYVPFTAIGAELLFEVFSRRYEHGATLVTSNLPFANGPASWVQNDSPAPCWIGSRITCTF